MSRPLGIHRPTSRMTLKQPSRARTGCVSLIPLAWVSTKDAPFGIVQHQAGSEQLVSDGARIRSSDAITRIRRVLG